MSTNDTYLNEVHPVAKEKKHLRLLEQSNSWIAWGFEATLEEMTEFFTQTSAGGKCLEDVIDDGNGWENFLILLVGERERDSSGKWHLKGKFCGYDVWSLGFSNIHDVFPRYDAWPMGLPDSGDNFSKFALNIAGKEEYLFRFFGMELFEELINHFSYMVEWFENADDTQRGLAEEAEFGGTGLVGAEVVISELSEAGKKVLETAIRRFLPSGISLAELKGTVNIPLWESAFDPSDDVLAVEVVSKLSKRERASRVGIDSLRKVENFHEIKDFLLNKKIFSISRNSAEAYLEGRMTGAEVINQLGEDVQRFCEAGQFELA
jgi:hypothetical protein